MITPHLVWIGPPTQSPQIYPLKSLSRGLSDFAEIWRVGSLRVPEGRTMVAIHLPRNPRWRLAAKFSVFTLL